MKRFFSAVLLSGTMLLFLLFPSSSLQGAKNGLLLWFHQVLPSLLPFFILTKLLVSLGLHRTLGKLLYPLLHPLFSLSSSGCFALVTGLLSGLPLGAKNISELYEQREVSKKEAVLLLALCSNPSPMFLISYAGIAQLKLINRPHLVLLFVSVSALLNYLICRILFYVLQPADASEAEKNAHPAETGNADFSFALLDTCMMSGFEAVTKIGGYIILFNMYAAVLPELLPFPEGSLLPVLLLCALEMTTGIASACSFVPDKNPAFLLVVGCSCFGGLSGLAQTKSVLSHEILSFGRLLLLKLCQCVLGILLALLYLRFFCFCSWKL